MQNRYLNVYLNLDLYIFIFLIIQHSKLILFINIYYNTTFIYKYLYLIYINSILKYNPHIFTLNYFSYFS